MALQFEGMKYAVVLNGGIDETGTFKIDATKTPWTFDLNIVEGPDASKLQLGLPGATARPANFNSADGAIAFVAVKVKK